MVPSTAWHLIPKTAEERKRERDWINGLPFTVDEARRRCDPLLVGRFAESEESRLAMGYARATLSSPPPAKRARAAAASSAASSSRRAPASRFGAEDSEDEDEERRAAMDSPGSLRDFVDPGTPPSCASSYSYVTEAESRVGTPFSQWAACLCDPDSPRSNCTECRSSGSGSVTAQDSPASALSSQSLCLKTPAAALGDGSAGSPLDLTPSPGKGGVGGSMSLIFD